MSVAGATGSSRPAAAAFLVSLGAAAALLAWCYAEGLPERAGVAYHHVASVRELAKGEFPPANNLVPGPIPVGHYGPYLVLLGWIARLTGADPLLLLEGAGIVLCVVYLIAFRALAARLVSAAAANWSVPAALLLWGPWPGTDMPWVAWGWPGTTSPADSQNFFYPQHAALTLLLWLLVEALGAWTWSRLARLVVIAALLIVTHPYTGFALATALAALVGAAIARRELRPRVAAGLLLVPVLGLLLAGAWPYYPVWRLLGVFSDANFRQPLPPAAVHEPETTAPAPVAPSAPPAPTSRGVDWSATVRPAWHILGPALFGLLGAVWLARRGRPLLLFWGLASLGLALCPLLPLRERLITFVALPLQLAATAVLDGLWRRHALGRGALVVLLAGSAFACWQRIEFVRDLPRFDLGFVARHTPDDAVILAPDGLANLLVGQTGRKTVCPEGPDLFLILAGGAARMFDQAAFYGWRATPAARERILARWGVTHVLVDRFASRSARFPGTPVAEQDGLILYDVRGAKGAERP